MEIKSIPRSLYRFQLAVAAVCGLSAGFAGTYYLHHHVLPPKDPPLEEYKPPKQIRVDMNGDGEYDASLVCEDASLIADTELLGGMWVRTPDKIPDYE